MKQLFTNGKIASLDSKDTFYGCMGVEDGQIIYLGHPSPTLLDSYDTVIDLKGHTLIPGLNDSHMHLLNYGYTKTKMDLIPFGSIEDMVVGGQGFLSNRSGQSREWLLGRGWNQDKLLEKRYPTRADLDRISTSIPIIFTRACGHISICNSAALNRVDFSSAGHLEDYVDKETGLFQEDALNLLYNAVPSPNVAAIKTMILDASKDLLAQGITSVQTDDLCCMPDQDYKKVLQAYKELHTDKALPVKVYQQCLFFEMESFQSFVESDYRTGQGDSFFKIGPLKLLLDGSLGARTAYLNAAYDDAPDTRGIPCFKADELNRLVDYALGHDFQLAAHGIGDGAMDMFMDALEASRHFKPDTDSRHGIVHAQITTYPLIDRMAKNSILAYIQPIFLDYDLHIVKDRVGKKALESYAFKTMKERGVKICLGTDAPVVDINPFENIYSAVVRKDLNGLPKQAYLPNECLTVTEALKAYTISGAYSSFEVDEKGSLEVGKTADFVVLNQDIFEVPVEDIKSIEVLMTVLNGKIVYQLDDTL